MAREHKTWVGPNNQCFFCTHPFIFIWHNGFLLWPFVLFKNIINIMYFNIYFIIKIMTDDLNYIF
jgi:hypothetical protein